MGLVFTLENSPYSLPLCGVLNGLRYEHQLDRLSKLTETLLGEFERQITYRIELVIPLPNYWETYFNIPGPQVEIIFCLKESMETDSPIHGDKPR